MASTAPNRLAGMGGQLGTLAMDLVIPVAGYYVLRAVGLEPVLALILAGVPTVAAIIYRVLRQRKVDALGIFVLTILAGSVALTFVTGSPRFLLAKEAWFTAAISAGFLVTLWFARPLAYSMARAMLRPTPLGAALAVDRWDEYWERDQRFRRTWRVATVLWGVGLLADAAVRMVMAYALPVDVVPALAGALWAVTFVALQVIQQIYFTRVGLWTGLRARAAQDTTGAAARRASV